MLKGSLCALAMVLLFIACGGGGSGPVGGTTADGGPPDGGAAPDGAAGDAAPTDGSGLTDAPVQGDGALTCGTSGGPSGSYTNEAACLQDVDCTYVMAGCWCGEQPALGVAKIHAVTASACQEKALQNCGLGCANFPGIRAEDGRTDADGGAVGVHCLKDAGANGLCRTTIE